MRLTLRVFFLLLGWTALVPSQKALAQICASPGKDGPGSLNANPNTYYPGVTANANATSITVGNSFRGGVAIGANDLLLVIQMQGVDISNANSNAYGDGVAGDPANGYTTNLTAGQYEYVMASSVVSGTGVVNIDTPLKNTYTTSAVGTTATRRTFQVVRVPQYTTLTLTGNVSPLFWDGTTGGITAVDVQGLLAFGNFKLDASSLGFRGGGGRVQTYGGSSATRIDYLTLATSNLNAQKGEGIAGSPRYVNYSNGVAGGAYTFSDLGVANDNYPGGSAGRGAPGNAGGGGNDNGNNSGGGGGANGGTGGRGGYSSINSTPGNAGNTTLTSYIGGEPGAAFAASSSSRLIMGGGGGAGTTNDGSGGNNGFASSGTPGGGIVIVRAGTVSGTVNGTGGISANGGNVATGVLNDGAGGAGAGGTILLTVAGSQTGLADLTMSAVGGTGGTVTPANGNPAGTAHGPGGGGGGGVVLTSGATKTALATSTAGGTNGTTNPAGTGGGFTAAAPANAFGATAGTDGSGQSSASISNTIANGASGASCSVINGTIFDDVNFGGGTGRSLGTAGTSATNSGVTSGVGSVGTTVELYNATTNALVATTTTTTGGAYSFTGVPAGSNYVVRVVNGTVKSARTPGATGLTPVQTFRTTAAAGTGLGTAVADGTRVGGEAPEKQDAGARTGTQTLDQLTAGTATPQSIATVRPGTSGVDFGYNFDLVVNINDAGQGSLRQFITNANALGNEGQLAQAGSYTDIVNLATGNTAAGRAPVALPAGIETSIFMIPTNRLTGGVAVITPTTALPQVTGVNTAINGSTQTFNIGNTNDVLLGAGGTVGTAATALSRLNGPEVQLTGSTAVATGLNIAGAGSRVRGLAIYGFGNNVDNDGNGNLVTSANNLLIAGNALGSTATSFAVPAVANVSANVRVASGTGLSFTNNLVGFAGGSGIYLAPGVTGTTLTSNEIRGNGRINTIFDGIDSHGSSTTATGNLFADGGGQGFDSFGSTGSNSVTGNTLTNNGIGSTTTPPYETAAARFYGTGNTFSQNVSTGNYGAGVEVVNGSTTLISRNAIYNNGNVTSVNGTAPSGQIGIDLVANGGNENTGNSPYVTLNSATTTGGNSLLNYPILRTANIVGTNLVLTGYAKPGATIELFTSQANALTTGATTGNNFGQGRTYLTTLTEGGTLNGVTDTDPATGLSYSGTVNGFDQGADTNASGFTFTIPLASLPGVAGGTVLTSTATLTGATSEFSGNVAAVVIAPLTGYVYEDVNYGGGAGRSRSTLGAAAIGRPGAKVELYNAAGALVGTTITDANGQYSFTTNVGTGYTVRVVNSSVLSSRAGATAASGSAAAGYVSDQLAVQTYNGTTTRVGGENPALTDAAANTGAQTLANLTSGTTVPESIATVSVGTGTNAGPDFGYNFDTVINTNDAGQGSLRQFIANANALGGEASLAQSGSNTAGVLPAGRETSIFMIPSGSARAGLLASTNGGPASQLNANGVAALAPASALPGISGPNTSIDGTTQTFNLGNTNNVPLGTGGPVGTGGTALAQLNGPEVQLKGTQTINGITLAANNVTVRGLSVYGFNTGILGAADLTGTRIEQNVIGASATSFSDPTGTNRTLNEGVNLNGSDNGFVANNLIGFNGGMGVWVLANGNGANGNSITGNEIRSNGLTTIVGNGERLVFDGLELQGNSTGNTVSGNLIAANVGHGIDSFGNDIGGNTVSGNTISGNGVGVANGTGEEGSGLRVFGTTNPTLISANVLTGNNGSGVLVIGGASQVTISENSTSGNTRLGIDLLSTAESAYGTAAGTVFWNGQLNTNSNATLNDNGDGDTGGNGLLNFPVLTTATVNATTLVVSGYARPNSRVELFLAAPLGTDPTGNNRYFGQGATFLAGRTEGLAGDDSNATTGTYGPAAINGVAQGTDNTNQFTFTVLLSDLTLAQRTALLNSTALLTSTATLASSTSEFSANTRVLQAPVPNDVTNATVASNQATPVVLSPNVSATAIGNTADITTSTANTIVSYVVSPIATAQGTLLYNGTAVTAATTVPAANIGQLTFVPTRGFVGNATFTYTALDANGQASATHSTGGTSTSGPATYTIPVAAAADVTASLTGGTTLSPGQPTGNYTATFTNLGPNAASNVAQVVTLPTGASLTTAQQNTLTTAYSGTTFVTTGSGPTAITTITFLPATTLANGAANSFRFAFTAPATTGSSTLAASTSTGSSEGANVAANSASLVLTTTPVVDVQAALAVGAASVAPGATATFTATFTNNSTPPAAGVVPTVQLPVGLTPASVSGQAAGTPSGNTVAYGSVATLNTTTGLLTYAATTLANGSPLASNITFVMPASGVVTATAAITTTTTESNPANNVNSASIAAAPRFDLATSLYGPTAVVAGAPLTLNVTTTNNSGQAIAGAVQTVQLPAGLNPSTNSPGVFISNGGTYDNGTGVVTFPALGSLPSGQTVANTITFLAPSAAFTPSAQVTPNTTGAGDTNTANNLAYLNGAASSTAPGATLTPTTSTDPTTNLVATLTTASTIVDAGTQVTYTTGALNAGPGAASGVTGRLQLLPGLNATTLLVNGAAGTLQADNVTYNFADGTTYKTVRYNSQTGLLSYAATAASLTSGASFSLPVAVTVPATVGNEGQLLATNSVGSATPESVPADNVKAVTVAVKPRSDLATTLTGPTSGVVPGQSVTYSATFTNNGPATARAVAQTVQLPAGLTASTLTVGGQSGSLVGTTLTFGSGATYDTTTGLVTLPALASNPAGAVQVFNLTFVAPAQSYVVSSATSSATTDLSPANNAASVATAVTPTADVAIALAGPATAVIGNYVTYALTTTNNGTSTALGVVPSVRLPSGLTIQGASPAGYTYDSATGLLTFPAISALQAGVSAESYVTFTMPNAAGGQLSALAAVSSTSADNVVANNTAALTTSVAPTTTTTADLFSSIAPTSTSAAPGSTVVYTAIYRNLGTGAATGAVPTASLPTGLLASTLQVGGVTGTLANGFITFGSGPANGASYEVATGLLTFPTVASLAGNASSTYSISFPAPASGQLLVLSGLNSGTTDSDPSNNRGSSSIVVSPAFDLTTSISGPAAALAGSQNVYTITTTNNGPSNVSSATQNVLLPTGLIPSTLLVAGQTGTLTSTAINFAGTGASYNLSSGLLTFAATGNLTPGPNGAVSNTITVTMPGTGSLRIGDATVGTADTGESNTTNNTASFTTLTAPLSFAPVARNIVNSLRSPEGNTANALAISPLNATDPDGSIANYYVQSLPAAGTLYYNGTAISSIPSGGYQVADAALLSYKPASGFVGAVSFLYTATDNSGVASNPALYTIPVAQDLASTYTAYNTAKGGANTYKTNDVLAQVIDPNMAVYTSAGTIYDATTGALQASAVNGLLTTGTNAVLAGTGPTGNTANTLPAGVSLDPATGTIFVSNAALLANNSTARTYSVFVNTTDANGGITQALATFTIGAYPLPVVLTAFTAQAVANRDALLRWYTASEKNNDHFDLERSFDGTAFAPIGQLAGHGTTSAAAAYAFTDAGVAAHATGPVYYRLRQVDLDGTATFSPVRSVRFAAEVANAPAPVALSLYPNPAQASTSLDLRQLPATGSYQVRLLDATGRTVRAATLAGGLPQPLSLAHLASGTYLVRVAGQRADGAPFQQTLRLSIE